MLSRKTSGFAVTLATLWNKYVHVYTIALMHNIFQQYNKRESVWSITRESNQRMNMMMSITGGSLWGGGGGGGSCLPSGDQRTVTSKSL